MKYVNGKYVIGKKKSVSVPIIRRPIKQEYNMPITRDEWNTQLYIVKWFPRYHGLICPYCKGEYHGYSFHATKDKDYQYQLAHCFLSFDDSKSGGCFNGIISISVKPQDVQLIKEVVWKYERDASGKKTGKIIVLKRN